MNVKMIASIAILGIGLLFVGLSLLKNRKNHWIFGVTRVAVALASIGLGIFVSNLLGSLLSSAFGVSLGASLIFPSGADFLSEAPVLEEAITGLVACVFSLILFVAVFFIVKAILNAIAKPIARKIILSVKTEDDGETESPEEDSAEPLKGKAKKKFKKNILRTPRANLYGMLTGAVVGLLIWVALFAPLVGISVVADQALSVAVSAEDEEGGMAMVADIADAAANNVGSKAVYYLGGMPISDALLSCNVDGHSVNLRCELAFFGKASESFSYLYEENADKTLAAGKIRDLSDEFEKTDLIPAVIPGFCSAARAQWDKGVTFMGLSDPMDGGDSFLSPIFSVMADATYDTVKEDVTTIFELVAEAVEADAWTQVQKSPLKIFENKEFSSSMLGTLLKNERLDGMVGGFMQIGIDSMANDFRAGAEHMDAIELDSDNVADAEKEAAALAEALCAVAKFADQGEFSAADSIRDLGGVLDLLKVTETVGKDNVEHLVRALLQSANFMDAMGISSLDAEEVAEAVIEGANKQSYRQVMASMSETIRVMEAANGAASLNESVQMLMKSLDTTSAKVLSAMAKPGTMIANGVPEKNATASASMMSSMFMNLSVMGEGMSREEFEAEANAVTNLTNLAMNASVSEGGAVFGEEGSMGISARDFVDQTLGSAVASKTIRDSVYDGEGANAKQDPLGTEMILSAEEEADVLSAMNERWATEESKDEQARQSYVALGSVLNIGLTVTENGVQKAQ